MDNKQGKKEMAHYLNWQFFKEENGETVSKGDHLDEKDHGYEWAGKHAEELAELYQCGIGYSANDGATCYRYPKKKRGRPAKPDAKTNAERQAEFRTKRKAEGICPCCGQHLLI